MFLMKLSSLGIGGTPCPKYSWIMLEFSWDQPGLSNQTPNPLENQPISGIWRVDFIYALIYIHSPQVRRPSFTRTFGLPRFHRAKGPYSPHVHHRAFSTLELFRRHCTHSFMVSEPQMTTENYAVSMLILTWTQFPHWSKLRFFFAGFMVSKICFRHDL
jgi:hypothetical protein